MSLFITFEGIEGSGKSTQIRLLNDFLKLRGYATLFTREPGGCGISDSIRQILLDSKNTQLSPPAELLLYSAARAQHIHEVIKPALAEGKIVLCDRFSDATKAYQGFARGFDLSFIDELNGFACEDVKPNLTFLLDLPVEKGLTRAQNRNASSSGPDESRFENEKLSFHKKVREGYLTLAKLEPERFVVVNANDEMGAIHQNIINPILKRLTP